MSVFNKNTRRDDVLRQQKTGVMTKGELCPGGGFDLPSSPASNVEPVTNISRPLLRTTDDGRRGECSTLAAVRRGFVFHTSRLVRLTTL